MFVRMWMSKNLVTVSPDTPIMEARDLMRKNNIRRLPVIKDGKLVGIVTFGDIQEASPSDATSLSIWELNYLLAKTTVAEIMTKKVITISPDDTIERAALMMRENKVGGLPVLEDGKLVGMITESDIFQVMIELMGIKKGGTRITLELENRVGALAEALNVIKEHNVNIASVVTCEEARTGPDYVVVVRMETEDFKEIVEDLQRHNIKVLDARK